jgi:hypothetical protein
MFFLRQNVSFVICQYIELFIEDQAFRGRMIRLIAHPLPTSCQQLVSLSQSYCVLPVELADGREGGG